MNKDNMIIPKNLKEYIDLQIEPWCKEAYKAKHKMRENIDYVIAKDIIHLILVLQEIINNDKDVNKYMKVVMTQNYNVSYAEIDGSAYGTKPEN